jgi:hypothetical protein
MNATRAVGYLGLAIAGVTLAITLDEGKPNLLLLAAIVSISTAMVAYSVIQRNR